MTVSSYRLISSSPPVFLSIKSLTKCVPLNPIAEAAPTATISGTLNHINSDHVPIANNPHIPASNQSALPCLRLVRIKAIVKAIKNEANAIPNASYISFVYFKNSSHMTSPDNKKALSSNEDKAFGGLLNISTSH
ncbi:hypothetical protein HMP0015_2374 [Acinetobacter haemolyticus ATCC 19194]|uniref:Uncharacterized protein n=1 Tax=Acinetobacter haemolyticus ATCC 19194 TaxID=707232 RepID=D4XRN2_ACIHA|nr:hypothetical protein HMP0015_2374 [Acinetobacter haemolyticus ATCC 19194]